jgi:hypothetical protein
MTAGDDVRVQRCRDLLTHKGAITRAALTHALDDPIPTAPQPPDTPQPPERPGPDNTGVPKGTELSLSTTVVTTHPFQLIQGRDITGMVKVQHDNVTIRGCRIRASDTAAPSDYPIKIAAGVTGTVIEDCEIDGNGRTNVGVAFKGYTARRCNIHGSADGIRADGNVTLEHSWVHDLARVTPTTHGDCVQILNGSNIDILWNTLDAGTLNSAFIISAQAPVDDVLIQGNLLTGGGWTAYLGANNKGVAVTNVTLAENTFGPSKYGAITAKGSAAIAGNVDHAGKAI